MSPQYILLRAKSVNKIPFTNEKIKFSKRVFGQAFSKKRVFEGVLGNFSQVKKVSPKISEFY